MENLVINATANSPYILFEISSNSESSLNENKLIIKGKSIPENAIEFYDVLENYLTEYLQHFKSHPLTIVCDLPYINSSSNKKLFQFLKRSIKKIKKLTIIWMYGDGDDDTLENGKDFETLLAGKFKFVMY